MRKLYLESEISGSRSLHALLTASDLYLRCLTVGKLLMYEGPAYKAHKTTTRTTNKITKQKKETNIAGVKGQKLKHYSNPSSW